MIRRGILLENHFDCVRMIASKAWPSMPKEFKSFTSADDLFQDCILELRTKIHKYDASRSKPVTFIYLVLQSYLSRQRGWYERKKRSSVRVHDYDVGTITDGHIASEVEGVSEDEAIRLFLDAYELLSPRLQAEACHWFFSSFSRVYMRSENARMFIVFRRVARLVGLTSKHCLLLMTNKSVKIRLSRQLCTLSARRYNDKF